MHRSDVPVVLPVKKEGDGVGVIDLKGHLAGDETVIDRNDHTSQFRDGEDAFDHLHAILEQDGDFIPCLNPQGLQAIGQTIHPVVQFLNRAPPISQDDRLLIGVHSGFPDQHLPEYVFPCQIQFAKHLSIPSSLFMFNGNNIRRNSSVRRNELFAIDDFSRLCIL
jgi:hypothetical protein